MAIACILRERPLNDDTIFMAEPGKCFRRRDYLVKVVYYRFANAWNDTKHVFYAQTLEAALKRYQRICGKLDDDTIDSVYCCAAC